MAQNDDAGSMQAYDTENTQAYDTESTEANDTENLQAAVEGYIKSKGDGRPSPLRGV
ncbi:MAG: hypothetical protein IJ805_05115 [Lachnospiraceae bacterium]|nr:hypothetical protein [Lachnospiraceae bacterium]